MRACSLEKSGMHESWFMRLLTTPRGWNHGKIDIVLWPIDWATWWYWAGNDKADWKRTGAEGAD